MKKLIAFVVAVFFLGIMLSFFLTIASALVTIAVCILLAVLFIKIIGIKLGYALLLLFLAMGVTLEIIPEIVNKPIYIILSWCVFLLGVYFLIRDKKNSKLEKNKN